VLPVERRVVGALLSSDDAARRRAVTEHVDAALAAMPEVIRLGIAAEAVVLGTVTAGRRVLRRTDPDEEVAWLAGHPVGLVRQWVRALRSLVLLAEQEMIGASAP